MISIYLSICLSRPTSAKLLASLQLWSAVSPLTISETPVSSDADIRLLYSTTQHGDNFPFDGGGGVLAHAFYPHSGALAGDVHFDDDERWTHDGREGTYDRYNTSP